MQKAIETAKAQAKILTFNHHESYLCALAGLNESFDVVTRRGALDLSWNIRARSVPSNMTLRDFADVKEDLRSGAYKTVICHTIKNLFWLLPYRRRQLIFVAHIPLFRNTPLQRFKSFCKRMIVLFWQTFFGLKVVAVSEFKRQSWNIQAEVARFFPVPFDPSLLASEKSADIHGAYVGNLIRERGSELGWPILEQILAELPVRVIGNNPGIPNAFVPKDFRDFVYAFSRAHFYVYPVSPRDGDGYNTASLEAMLLGLPTVAIANPTSPIQHEVNGLIAQDANEMMVAIRRLQADSDLRSRLGAAARETVLREFSADAFWATWKKVIASIGRT